MLTVKDMVLVNLPNSPSQYPAGLLSSMPWYLDSGSADTYEGREWLGAKADDYR